MLSSFRWFILYFQLILNFVVTDNKAELKAALWRIPLVDETEPPSPSLHGGPGHSRSLNKLCDLGNDEQGMRRYTAHCETSKTKQFLFHTFYSTPLFSPFLSTSVFPCHSSLKYLLFSCCSVLWNPSGDGSQLITLSDQHLKLWQLKSEGREVQVTWRSIHSISSFMPTMSFDKTIYHIMYISL